MVVDIIVLAVYKDGHKLLTTYATGSNGASMIFPRVRNPAFSVTLGTYLD